MSTVRFDRQIFKFVGLWLILGLIASSAVLENNISLVGWLDSADIIESINTSQQLDPPLGMRVAPELRQSESDARLFLYSTYALLSCSLSLFIFVVSRYLNRPGGLRQNQQSINVHLESILSSIVGLVIIGYVFQLSLMDPLNGPISAYGQPYIYQFSFDGLSLRGCFSNPFVAPSLVFGVCSLMIIAVQISLWKVLYMCGLIVVPTAIFALSTNRVNGWVGLFLLAVGVAFFVFGFLLQRGLSRKDQRYRLEDSTMALLQKMVQEKISKSLQEMDSIGWSSSNQLRKLCRRVFFWTWVSALIAFVALLGLDTFGLQVTWVEFPKMFLIVGMAGYVTEINRSKMENFEESERLRGWLPPTYLDTILGKSVTDRMEFVQQVKTFGLGAIVLCISLLLFVLLNDTGAILIIGFAFILIHASLTFGDRLGRAGVVLYTLTAGFLCFAPSMLLKHPDTWFVRLLMSEDRISDWLLTDYFFTSGLGDSHIVGTSSSPDFARALWGISSGGFFGRWTGLFASQGSESLYAATMSFAYNDRSASGIVEVFGVLGLVVVLFQYSSLIKNCLKLIDVQQRTYLPGFGLAFGLAAFIFGQTVVHIGGNFGFSVFTGVVLPFISHSGTALLLTLMFFTVLIILYGPVQSFLSGTNEPTIKADALVGMQGFVGLTYVCIGCACFYLAVVEGPNNSLRIRYDVQSDMTVKETINPRFFMLSSVLSTSRKIADVEGRLVKDSNGTYPYAKLNDTVGEEVATRADLDQYEGFNDTDYFLHAFEQYHRLTLRGLNRERLETMQYYEQRCVLKDGDYVQYAGHTHQLSQERQKMYQSSLGNDNDQYDCSVAKVEYSGTLWTNQRIGIPLNPRDPSAGCVLDNSEEPFKEGFVSQDSSKYQYVWFFDKAPNGVESPSVQSYIEAFQAGQIHLLSEEDIEGTVFGLFGSQQATQCIVSEVRIASEVQVGIPSVERSLRNGLGVIAPQSCMVRGLDGSTQYYTNDEEGETLPKTGSARSIAIDFSEDNICTVDIQRVACELQGKMEIDTDTPDLDNGLEKVSVYYGNNRRIGLVDSTCRVEYRWLGEHKHLSSKRTQQSLNRLTSAYLTSSELSRFSKYSWEKQFEVMKTVSEKLKEVEPLKIGLQADAQARVRQLLQKYRQEWEVPSIQAIVFDLSTGQILVQAQHSAVRSDFQETFKRKGYAGLFVDHGMYGYGINQLKSYLVPASTFKVLHALTAIEAEQSEFKHICSNKGYQPIDSDWGGYHIQDWSKGKGHGHLNLKEGLKLSCNQYFASLAVEGGTHPDVLSSMCSKKGLEFSPNGDCKLAEQGTPGAGMNGFGQGITMNLYQISNILFAAGANREPYLEEWDAYMTPEQRHPLDLESVPLFDDDAKIQKISTTILPAMRTQYPSYLYNESVDKIRVYGKTGTGDHNISIGRFTKEREGDFISKVKYNGRTVWVENYEKPYGVQGKWVDGELKGMSAGLYMVLVEDSEMAPDLLGTHRLGVVVRLPRLTKNIHKRPNGGKSAAPIARDIIKILRDLDMIPTSSN